MPVSTPPRSGLLVDGTELARNFAREMQSDNEELCESNRQLIATLEEVQSLNVTLQSVNQSLHATNVELRSELDQLRSRASDLDHMLNAIGVAVVLLGEGLLVRDYNALASRFFALKKPDIGRSISRVRHEFVQTSLPELCREALDSGEPLERITTGSGGDRLSLRIRELDLGAGLRGLLLTVTEITNVGLEARLEPPSSIA